MTILKPSEAAKFLRTSDDDPVMLMLLPLIDEHIKGATGRDWSADTEINGKAKAAAGMILVQWYDNPTQMGSESPLAMGVLSVLTQLEAEALKYRKYAFYGLSGAGSVAINGAQAGDNVVKLIGVYNVSGDQTTKFESNVSSSGYLKQTSSDDLSNNIYVVILKSPIDDVSA